MYVEYQLFIIFFFIPFFYVIILTRKYKIKTY